MKHHARAALAAVALTLIPGAVLASSVCGSGFAVAYNADDGDLIAQKGLGLYDHLQLGPNTDFIDVDNPDLMPDSNCTVFGNMWHDYVVQKKPAAYFGKLMVLLSANSCRVEYTRTSTASPDGLYTALTIRPVQ